MMSWSRVTENTCVLKNILKYDLVNVSVNSFRRAMSNVVKAFYNTDKCKPSHFVDRCGALKNTFSQFLHLQINFMV